MNYKLKYHNLVLYFIDISDLKEEVFNFDLYDDHTGGLWEDGTEWGEEPEDVFLKEQVFKSKLLKVMFL